jgi:DNA helicase-2/ATP-dependent DNA helicase PcrA
MDDLPSPLRIADDWEERYIVLEDIKSDLSLSSIDDARELFARLEADWESLEVESSGWQPDPRFIGARSEHTRCFQYLLRAELVYRLKRALEQMPQFSFEHDFRFLLVDEYQDLNKCDLAIIRKLASNGLEVYAAGDDDQSIYGFRKAHPDGIRQFLAEFVPSSDLVLHVCRRCPRTILDIAEFVAEQDTQRLRKDLRPEDDATGGTVKLTVHDNQDAEAQFIAHECADLVAAGLSAGQILILLRGDRKGIFSGPISAALSAQNLPVASNTETSPLDEEVGRQILALLRISVNPVDSLAWRTMLALRRNGIGERGQQAIRDLARGRGISFADAIVAAYQDASALPRQATALRQEHDTIMGFVGALPQPDGTKEPVSRIIRSAADALGIDPNCDAVSYLNKIAGEGGSTDIESLLHAIETSRDDSEQSVDPRAVNILTMHKAKGLTAEAVFIAAAEDEYVPGRAATESEVGDERRLLYVSMTRARQLLSISYCAHRYGQQQRTGRNIHTGVRTLTRFLRDAPLRPV